MTTKAETGRQGHKPRYFASSRALERGKTGSFQGSGFGMNSGNASGETGAHVPTGSQAVTSFQGQQSRVGRKEVKGLDPAPAL